MMKDAVAAQLFEQTIGDKRTGLWYLRNNKGIEISVTNFGCRIVQLIVPDPQQKPVDVVVGFDSLDAYRAATEPFHGTIVGRYANRINRGKFTLHGKTYELPINNKPNHLHGGPGGFHNRVWDMEGAGENTIRLSYLSVDGEEGYPGNLKVFLTYLLDDEGRLSINYEAQTDQATVINLTSHPFFNLNGQGEGSIESHFLQINASRYNPVDSTLIPTGIEFVENTPFDFRSERTIGARLHDRNEQLKFGGGYDHNFILDGEGNKLAAIARGDRSGITMQVTTDQPAIQLYSGNFMKSENVIKYGKLDTFRSAFCLETQHFPDSPNQPQFPSTVLEPGQTFRSTSAYRFI